MFNIHRGLFNSLKASICFVTLLLTGMLSAAQSQRELPEAFKYVPDQTTILIGMTGDLNPNASGSNLEKWLAQDEVKNSFQNILDLIDENLPPDTEDFVSELLELSPEVVFRHPWVLYVTNVDPDNFDLKFVVFLGEREKKIMETLEASMKGADGEISDLDIDGRKYKSARSPSGQTIEFGVEKKHLMVAVGEGELAKLIASARTGEAKCLTEIRKELVLERTLGIASIDVKQLAQSLSNQEDSDEDEDEDSLLKNLKFDEVEKIVGVFGFDGPETVSRISVHCPKVTGFWKTFDVKGLTKDGLNGIPDSIHSVTSLKFDPRIVWDILVNSNESKADLETFRDSMLEQLDIDFEKDVIDSFGGHLYSYQQLSLVNPYAGFVVAFTVKNPESMNEKLATFARNFEEINEDIQLETEETKNGVLYRVTPLDPNVQMVLPGVCFQLIDDELILALDDKAISSHLRKAKRDGNKLVDDPRVASLFDNQKNGGLGQPIGFFYLDMKVFIETIYTVVPMVMGQLEQFGTDFGFDMELLPSMEAATNGVLPDIIGIYRTEKGFQMVEKSTLPGISSASGIAIAMILPAVQQVRGAARSATSNNNLKQIGLALHNYESAYRKFPSDKRDTDGKKLLSWRVAILPFLEENELYEKFKQDEPWDSPHNLALVEEMPECFKNPKISLEPGMTTYLGVSGKNAAFETDGKKRTFAQIVDGTSNTIWLVETNEEHAQIWTRPDDFNVDEIMGLAEALKNKDGTVTALMMDASVRRLSNPSDEKLEKLFTINGLETVDLDDD